jgi:hypothetical protein
LDSARATRRDKCSADQVPKRTQLTRHLDFASCHGAQDRIALKIGRASVYRALE